MLRGLKFRQLRKEKFAKNAPKSPDTQDEVCCGFNTENAKTMKLLFLVGLLSIASTRFADTTLVAAASNSTNKLLISGENPAAKAIVQKYGYDLPK
jgi:hypothetical protein